MSDSMIRVSHVSKEYQLGLIGGRTFRRAFDSRMARLLHREDPNLKIGQIRHQEGETFYALRDICFEVKKGETLGIIGRNGAGKSTLLKLLCRVTGPTEGAIGLNGRVASMLEVGTGFHPELTGRENIYMNGAILGMTRAEIDSKIEEIIDFSEVRQFIDTPVKRYSSGMYVKLAFSVAAHLDSEIMIMDEVLAVGDMAFQQKCLDRMRNEAGEGRTVLYVSHNMDTIRQLCDRCIVLEHGRIVFDGDTEEAIRVYMGSDAGKAMQDIRPEDDMRPRNFRRPPCEITSIHFEKENTLDFGDQLVYTLEIANCQTRDRRLRLRSVVESGDGRGICMGLSDIFDLKTGEKTARTFSMDISSLVPDQYILSLHLMGDSRNSSTGFGDVDKLPRFYIFTIRQSDQFKGEIGWNTRWWGHTSVALESKNAAGMS